MARITRRELGAAAALALAAPAVAQDEKPKRSAADALMEIVEARYGKQLDEVKLKAVRQSLAANLTTAERLRKLAVADEPAFAFSADWP